MAQPPEGFAWSDSDPGGILADLGIGDVRSIEPVSGGWDARLWRVQANDRSYALRVFGPGRANTCRFELAAMHVAAAAGIPVPEVYASSLSSDRSALLLSWVAGRPLLHHVLDQPHDLDTVSRLAGEIQARIHDIQAPQVLRDRPSWMDWAGEIEPGLRRALERIPTRSDALLHFDINPMNVMTDGQSITGILDWTNAHGGDPRADTARTTAILSLSPLPPGVSRDLADAFLVGWRDGYGHLGDHMALFYAWAGATMYLDLLPKVGMPGIPLQPTDLERMTDWSSTWMARAGIE